VAFLDPAPVRRFEIRDEVGCVHAQERLVAVIGRGSDVRTRAAERVTERVAALRFLVARDAHAEPDARTGACPRWRSSHTTGIPTRTPFTLPAGARQCSLRSEPWPTEDDGFATAGTARACAGPGRGDRPAPDGADEQHRRRARRARRTHDRVARRAAPRAYGVTVIVPDALDALFDRPIAAGTAVLNGAGELTNSIAIGSGA